MVAARRRIARLKRRADFLLVAAARRKYAAPALVLQARQRDAGSSASEPTDLVRLGFTVTRKIGSSVVRNRARRRLREAARDAFAELASPGCDYVVVARAGSVTRPYDALVRDMRDALTALTRRERAA